MADLSQKHAVVASCVQTQLYSSLFLHLYHAAKHNGAHSFSNKTDRESLGLKAKHGL